jgi:hypothetical protein
MELSIIIVNYRTYTLTKQTIESIINSKHDFSYKIFLVDNASNDGSIEKLERDFSIEIDNDLIEIIQSAENLGFAYANNLALNEIDSEYVLLLNSDTVVLDDCLEQCINYIKSDEEIGALGCRVCLPNGDLDKACRRSFPDVTVSFYRLSGLSRLFPNSKRFNKYNMDYLDDDGIYSIDCIVGAFMLLKNSVIHEIGFLDENFFMYGEDIDWCYRIKEAGFKIIYYGKSKIIHYKGSSSKKQKSKLIYHFYHSMYLFYNKHYKKKNNILTTLLTYLGIGLLCCLKLFLNLFKKKE